MALFNTNFNPQIDREETLKALGLSSLLGQSAVEQPQADITVTGQTARPPLTPSLDVPQTPLDSLKVSPEQLQKLPPLEGLPQHKGMFGVKGTLRDVLGMIGDAFLVQGGNKAMYAPQRQKERIADAMVGFTDNPLDAIKRVSYIDPETGFEHYKNYQDRNYQDSQLENAREGHQNTASKNKSDLVLKVRDRVARGLNAAKTPEERQAVINQATQLGEMLNLTPEELGIDTPLTDADARVYAGSDMTVNQQTMQDYRRQKMEQDESQFSRAERGRMARDNPPPPPPRPRAQTPLEYYQEVSGIPASRRTPEQSAFLKKYTHVGKGNRFGNLAPPPKKGGSPTSSGKMVFRNGELVPAK